ncbi:MAG: M48 family metallopeptidase [Acidobacteriota bacterium]
MRRLVVAALLLTLAGLVALPAAASDTTPTTDAKAPSVAPAADSGQPVAVPVPSDKAMRYYRTGNVLWLIDNAWGLLVPFLLLLTGLSRRMRDLAARIGRKRLLTVALYGVLFVIVMSVAGLPLGWYESFVRPHAYGLSQQTAAKWWRDQATGLALGCIFIALTLWFPYWLLRKSPRRWWLWTGLASAPLLAVILLVAPIWIDPLFNKFGPMQDKALETRILALAERAGIQGSRVYEVDKSVDTNTVNAYVTGFLGTQRIVLWDTILAKLDPNQLLFVMGHEMGHYVLGHVWKTIGAVALAILLGLYVVHRTAGLVLRRYGARFGFSELADVASLPLLLLLFSLVGFALDPAILAFSRYTEHEADRFGLEITRDNRACGTAFVALQRENLSNPRPGLLYKLWRSDHPPLGERIDFCNEYRPWETGEPLRYGDLIRPRG